MYPVHSPALSRPGDARGDAADGVLVGGLGVLRPYPALELRPVDEVQHRFTAEPPRGAGRQAAQRHRLPGNHVEAGSDSGGPAQRALERLRHVVGVHVMQDAQPIVRRRKRLTCRQGRPDTRIQVAGGVMTGQPGPLM